MPVLSFVLALTSCRTPGPVPKAPPGAPQELPAAANVAAADLNGDGFDELIRIDDGVATLPDGTTHALGGVFQLAASGDTDGDGLDEALIVTGAGRTDRTAPLTLWRIEGSGAEQVFQDQGQRNQAGTLQVIDGRIWLARFTDDRTVSAGFIEGGAHQIRSTGALATAQVPVGEDVVVGRVYGDEPRSDGDLKKVRGGTTTALPSFRGVRALAASDLDGDGDQDVLAADGWHYAYGENAVGRVALLPGPDHDELRVIAHLPNDYSVRQLLVVDGDVVAVGVREVHLLRRDALGWSDHTLARTTEQGNAVVVQTPTGPAVYVSGSPALLVPLEGG